jgi:hypothetical protein
MAKGSTTCPTSKGSSASHIKPNDIVTGPKEKKALFYPSRESNPFKSPDQPNLKYVEYEKKKRMTLNCVQPERKEKHTNL